MSPCDGLSSSIWLYALFMSTIEKIGPLLRVMFNFEHTKTTQLEFEQLAQVLTLFKHCYATSKFDVGKIIVELNLPLKTTAIFRKKRATRIPLQLQERVHHLLDILTHFYIIAPVNTDSLTTGNIFINQVFNLKNENY